MEPALIFFVIATACNFALTTQWAKHGFFELGLMANKIVIVAILIGTATVYLSNYFVPKEEMKALIEDPFNLIVYFGLPLAWYLILRFGVYSTGLADYNRARHRLEFWMAKHYRLGRIVADEAKSLREFGKAKDAERLFRRALETQLRGERTTLFKVDVQLSQDNLNYYGDQLKVKCPACHHDLELPWRGLELGVGGNCNFCGAVLTARQVDQTVVITAAPSQATYVYTERNKYNVVVIKVELALLYRLMSRLNEAVKLLAEALKLIEELLAGEPNSEKFLAAQALIFFRQAEIKHAQGDLTGARQGYNACLALDRRLNNLAGVENIKACLRNIDSRLAKD